MSLARRSLPHTANELISCAFFIIRDVIMFILMLSLFSFVFCLDHVFFLLLGSLFWCYFFFAIFVSWVVENGEIWVGKSAPGNPSVRQQKQPLWLLWGCLLLPSCMSSSSSSFSLLLLLYFYLRLSVSVCHSLLCSFSTSAYFSFSISCFFFPLCLYVNGYGQTDRISGGQINRQIQVDRRMDEQIDMDVGIGRQNRWVDKQINRYTLSPPKTIENHRITLDLLHKIIPQLQTVITDFSLLCVRRFGIIIFALCLSLSFILFIRIFYFMFCDYCHCCQ